MAAVTAEMSLVCFDSGDSCLKLKAQSRVRDLSSGELRYRWTETGALDHYRYAHAFDHLYGAFRRACGVGVVDFV